MLEERELRSLEERGKIIGPQAKRSLSETLLKRSDLISSALLEEREMRSLED